MPILGLEGLEQLLRLSSIPAAPVAPVRRIEERWHITNDVVRGIGERAVCTASPTR
jgi:hypothetical protein